MALDARFLSPSSFLSSLTPQKPNPSVPHFTLKRRAHVPRQPTRRLSAATPAAVSALVSERTEPIKLTYLEGNSWLWDVGGLNILVDPILVGNLDFGIPWLYDASKKFLRNFRLEDLPELDCLLITQSLDDHCHVKTLKPLSKKVPDLRVISTPNAESILTPLFRNVTYLEPSQSSEVEGKNGAKVNITATAGPVLGPPWQRPENGYIITCKQSQLTLYYEPHCVYNRSFLQNYQADVIITPVIKQLLPGFTLVSGQEDAVNLAKLLQAKYVVPMKNGDLDGKGILSSIINTEGTVESFKVNSYPTVRGFTAIGTGGDDFVQAMVVAVESVLQEPIPKGQVTRKVSSRGKYVSVNIGPIRVVSSEQVQAVYNAMRRDDRMKYFL